MKYWFWDRLEIILIVAALVVGGTVIGLFVGGVFSVDLNCPKHEHLVITSWVPIVTKYSTTIVPIYACQPG